MFKQVARIKFWFLFLLFAQAWGEENNVCMGNKEETLAKLRALKKHYECAMSNSLTECSDWLKYSAFAATAAGIGYYVTRDGASVCPIGASLDKPSLFQNIFHTSVTEAVAAPGCMSREAFTKKFPQTLKADMGNYLRESERVVSGEITSIRAGVDTTVEQYLKTANPPLKKEETEALVNYAKSLKSGDKASAEGFKKGLPSRCSGVLSSIEEQARPIKVLNKTLVEVKQMSSQVAKAGFEQLKSMSRSLPIFPKSQTAAKALDTIRLQVGMSQADAVAARSAAAKVVGSVGERALGQAALARMGVVGVRVIGGTVFGVVSGVAAANTMGCQETFSRYSTLADDKCEDSRVFDEKKMEFLNLPEEEQWKEIGEYRTLCEALRDMHQQISSQVWKAQCNSEGGYTLTNRENVKLTQTVKTNSQSQASRAIVQGLDSGSCQFMNLDEQTQVTSVAIKKAEKDCDINQNSGFQHEVTTEQILKSPVTLAERMSLVSRERIKARDAAEGAWGLFKNSHMAHVEVSKCCSDQTTNESLCKQYEIMANSPSPASGPAKPSTGLNN